MSIGMVDPARRVHAARPLLHLAGQIADRQDALQRGRQAMELMTRQLRSQVCVSATATSYSARWSPPTDNSVTFYGSLSESSTSVKKRTLTFDPARRAGSITQIGDHRDAEHRLSAAWPSRGAGHDHHAADERQAGQDGAPPRRPVFRYYRYKAGAPDGRPRAADRRRSTGQPRPAWR